MWICIAPCSEHTSKALRYGTRSQGYLHTPRSYANGMNHTCLCLPSRSWYSFTDPEGWKAELALGGWLHSDINSTVIIVVLLLLQLQLLIGCCCCCCCEAGTHLPTPQGWKAELALRSWLHTEINSSTVIIVHPYPYICVKDSGWQIATRVHGAKIDSK